MCSECSVESEWFDGKLLDDLGDRTFAQLASGGSCTSNQGLALVGAVEVLDGYYMLKRTERAIQVKYMQFHQLRILTLSTYFLPLMSRDPSNNDSFPIIDKNTPSLRSNSSASFAVLPFHYCRRPVPLPQSSPSPYQRTILPPHFAISLRF